MGSLNAARQRSCKFPVELYPRVLFSNIPFFEHKRNAWTSYLVSVHTPAYLILFGTRVFLFPLSVKSQSHNGLVLKSHSSFCPHFHPLCPTGLWFCCIIWETFPSLHVTSGVTLIRSCKANAGQRWRAPSCWFCPESEIIPWTQCSQIQSRNNNSTCCCFPSEQAAAGR